MSFLHGVELIELNGGTRPIATPKASVVGLVGTAEQGPVNEPVLIEGSRSQAVQIFGAQDGTNTIPDAIDAIFDQTGALIVVINVGSNSAKKGVTATADLLATDSLFDVSSLTDANIIAGTKKNPQVLSKDEKTTYALNSDFIGVKSIEETLKFESEAVALKYVPFADTVTVEGKTVETDFTLEGSQVRKVEGAGINDGDEVKITYNYATTIGIEKIGVIAESNLAKAIAKTAGTQFKIKIDFSATQTANQITKKDIQGGIEKDTGKPKGILALLAAQSAVHVTPRLLIAPGFTHEKTVCDELLSVAERLKSIVIADGPDSTNAAAKTYAKKFGSPRLYLVDPKVKIDNLVQVASPRVTGVIVKSDNERGFWYSPSNRTISGITGTHRPIDFALGDKNAAANLLNENKVATIISQDGYRLWGNRTTSADPKWMFISVRRTADILNDALLRSHMWAVDLNITADYITAVVDGVNKYLRHLTTIGAILGGNCWADPDLNTADQITQGKVTFDFDFTPPYPAEHITFRSSLVDNYISEVI
jgi:phage tail sheath protein FI